VRLTRARSLSFVAFIALLASCNGADDLGVFSREVGSSGDGWFASEGGVAAVMVVGV
jgi:hypothetical protein